MYISCFIKDASIAVSFDLAFALITIINWYLLQTLTSMLEESLASQADARQLEATLYTTARAAAFFSAQDTVSLSPSLAKISYLMPVIQSYIPRLVELLRQLPDEPVRPDSALTCTLILTCMG
jgi:hypothetical protein